MSLCLQKIPRLWNSTVFILGGGPSINAVDFSLIKDKHIVGVNDAFKLGNWVDVCWFGDERWYQWNKEKLRHYQGILFGCPPNSHKIVKVINVLRSDICGISPSPDRIYWNKSSGGSAINLAYHLGATKIVLLGYDMHVVDDRHNWHSNHKHIPRNDIYERRFIPPFEKIAQDADRIGLEIINATPNSALTVFPHKRLEDLI